MPYEFPEDLTTSDVAFQAWAKDLPELFESAALALTEIMVDLKSVKARDKKIIKFQDKSLEDLLYNFLEELVFIKDVENFLLKEISITINKKEEIYSLEADLKGEKIDPKRHVLKDDIKAVTLYAFEIKEEKEGGYRARVVLDV